MNELNNTRLTHCLTAIAAVSLLVLCGCEEQLETGYGRAFGTGYSTSVNGTMVFQRMVKGSRRDVDRYGRISPRWQKYQTVYWFPDGFAAPDDETLDRIEAWLAADWNRTLVLVGRDFNAESLYWEWLREQADDDPDRELERGLVDAITGDLSIQNRVGHRDCDWYQTRTFPFQRATQLNGPLAKGIDTSRTDLRFSSLPLPGDLKVNGSFRDYQVEILLTIDSIPFCYSLQKDGWPQSRIIVVGNGSFLLNLPLTVGEHQKLADNLIQYVNQHDPEFGDVLFIESGPQIPYSENEDTDHSKWMWITSRPLRYIIPNILFWCLLLCFVYFPIFGRPRRIERQATADFRDHILALAALMSKTRSRKEPDTWIEEYRRRTSRHGGGSRDTRTRTDEKSDHEQR